MLDLLEMIFGTADAADFLLNGNDKKSNGKYKIPKWIRLLFFVLIYGSALFVGIAGGFLALEESHIVRAIVYWTFTSCLVLFLILIIYKYINQLKS